MAELLLECFLWVELEENSAPAPTPLLSNSSIIPEQGSGHAC